MQQLSDSEAELARHQTTRPITLTAAWAAILPWDDRVRKQPLGTQLDEVNVTARGDASDPHACLVLRWKGDTISELAAPAAPTAAENPH